MRKLILLTVFALAGVLSTTQLNAQACVKAMETTKCCKPSSEAASTAGFLYLEPKVTRVAMTTPITAGMKCQPVDCKDIADCPPQCRVLCSDGGAAAKASCAPMTDVASVKASCQKAPNRTAKL